MALVTSCRRPADPSDGFTAELELYRYGLVVRYPELAEHVGDEPG